MQIKIRAATEKDADEIARLESACFALPWDSRAVVSAMRRTDFCGVLAENERGETVGYVLGLALFENAEVLRIAVREDLRGNKIGGTLLDAFCSTVKARGAERVFLEVRQSNAAAIALYETRAFARGRVRERYYENGENALEMSKKL